LSSTVIPLRLSTVESSLKVAAFDHLSLPVVCVNASAQVLTANAAAASLFSLTAENLVGRHLSEFLAYSNRAVAARRWARFWTRLVDAGRLHVSIAAPLTDGRRLELTLEGELLRLDSDNVAAIVVRDIAARRQAERERRIAARRAALLAPVGFELSAVLGADRRVLQWGGDWTGEHTEAAGGERNDRSLAERGRGPLVAESGARPVSATSPLINASPPRVYSPSAARAAAKASADLGGVPFELLLDDVSAGEFVPAFERAIAAAGQCIEPLLWRLRTRAGHPAFWIEVTLTSRLHEPLVRAMVLHARDMTPLAEARARVEQLERRLHVLAETCADVLMVLDANGVVRFQAPAIGATLGVAPAVTLGQHGSELAAAEDRAVLRALLAAAVGTDEETRTFTSVIRANHADGSVRRLSVTVRNCLREPAIRGVLVAARDITRAIGARAGGVEQARRLELRERLLALAIQTRADFAQSLIGVLRSTAEALAVTAASFWRRTTEPAALRCESRFDRRNDRFDRDWVGVQFPGAADDGYLAVGAERKPVAVADTASSALTRDLAAEPRWREVRALVHAPVLLDGEVQGVLSVEHDAPRAWDDDEISFLTQASLVLALAMEAAQRQEAESRIEQLAWYDSLTGLPNRNLLRESMRDMIMSAGNRRRRIAVMLIDLDRFKDVNDTLGHLVGDSLIKSAAQVLNEVVGDSGMVARLGGDEFVVLVKEFEHRQEVALLAARITQALHRTDLVPNVDTQVSASIGVALFPEHGREMSTLLKNADAAMYQAKRDGRNQFSFFNPIRYERAAREVQLGIQLLKTLQSDAQQFVVEYQPQVEMASGRVVGFEALIRWNHPTFGRLTPDRFIGVAEVSGLSDRITRWVVNEVCAQIVRWREVRPGFDIPVAINVAGREMGTAALPILMRAMLLKYAIEPQMITLEITERTLVRESEINNDVLAELNALGVGLVLDDFGTGYSMLGYLKRMPIQALKIDQSFIVGIPEDADSRAIVHAMLAVARHFRLKVVAEGVENRAQVDYLRSIGCEYAQGFFFARALSPQTILEFVERNAAPQ